MQIHTDIASICSTCSTVNQVCIVKVLHCPDQLLIAAIGRYVMNKKGE